MLVAEVVGNIWATRKEESMQGLKLMIVRPVEPVDGTKRDSLVAIDHVGAGIGETVLVTQGSSARLALKNGGSPVDAAIVGIVDEMEVRQG